MRYVLLASYGNDSSALMQHAWELGLNDVCVLYNDTGWAAPEWQERVMLGQAMADVYGFDFATTKSEGLEALVKRKKAWPRQGMQFCTLHLKIEPTLAWLDKHDPMGLATCCVGVRREESNNRKDFPEYIESSANHGGRAVWAPLARVKEAERDALLARAGLPVLPHRSMECFPCINSNRADLVELAKRPAAVERVARIEGEMGHTAKGKPRTMFRPYRHMGATGIHEMVRWAGSARGEFDPDDGTGGGSCDSGFCGI